MLIIWVPQQPKEGRYFFFVNSRRGRTDRTGTASCSTNIIAELSHARLASGAPWVRKFGKLSIRENLVLT